MHERDRRGFVGGGGDNLNESNRRLDMVARGIKRKRFSGWRGKEEREDVLVQGMKLDVKRLLHSISSPPSNYITSSHDQS